MNRMLQRVSWLLLVSEPTEEKRTSANMWLFFGFGALFAALGVFYLFLPNQTLSKNSNSG
jgi:hypothetical protein